jgi:hypothetical protein
MHRAVDHSCNGFFPIQICFPEPSATPAQTIRLLSMFNRSLAENKEQALAVTQIVYGMQPCIPYIIFGPPGTGMTI